MYCCFIRQLWVVSAHYQPQLQEKQSIGLFIFLFINYSEHDGHNPRQTHSPCFSKIGIAAAPFLFTFLSIVKLTFVLLYSKGPFRDNDMSNRRKFRIIAIFPVAWVVGSIFRWSPNTACPSSSAVIAANSFNCQENTLENRACGARLGLCQNRVQGQVNVWRDLAKTRCKSKPNQY